MAADMAAERAPEHRGFLIVRNGNVAGSGDPGRYTMAFAGVAPGGDLHLLPEDLLKAKCGRSGPWAVPFRKLDDERLCVGCTDAIWAEEKRQGTQFFPGVQAASG